MLIQALAHSHVTILGALYDGINKLGKSRLSITSEEPGAKPDLWSEDFVLIRGDYPEMKTLYNIRKSISLVSWYSPFKWMPDNAVQKI